MSERQQDTQGWTGPGAAPGATVNRAPAHGTSPVTSRAAATNPGMTPVDPGADTTVIPPQPRVEREVLADAQARQRERFGGTKIGAAFFGWLVAVGMTVLLTAIAAGIGALIGASTPLDPAGADAAAIGIAGAITILVVLALAYFSGGYVAGRLARFDGTRNGVLSWVIGIVATVAVAVAGTAIGSSYDLAARVSLPAVPADLSALTLSGVIALVVVLLVTALFAALGGRMGERFHRRVERKTAKEF